VEPKRILAWTSWLSLAAAGLVAGTAVIARWGVNAESLGAHDAGIALSLSFLSAYASIGALYAAPVLALAGLASLSFWRDAGLRFLAAAAVCALALWPYT
jgi:hypothetical protein